MRMTDNRNSDRDNDRSYFRRPAAEEDERARTALSPAAKEAHAKLAGCV
jgi:hypothetical protein